MSAVLDAWLKSGKVVLDSQGRVVRCAACPCTANDCTACTFVNAPAATVYITFQNGTGGASTLNGLTLPLAFNPSAGYPDWKLAAAVNFTANCRVEPTDQFGSVFTHVSCFDGFLAVLVGFKTSPTVSVGLCSAAGPAAFPKPYNCSGPVVSTAVAVPITDALAFPLCDCVPPLIGQTVDIVLSI